MGVHKRIVTENKEFVGKNKDKDKMYYLFWQRIFSIEEIEHYFKGKYTYNEVRDIIRAKRKEYYEKENANGR